MKVGVIGAGTMGQGIAKAFAQVDGYTVALCDIKQEWAEGGKDKIAKGYARLVEKGKMTQETVDGILTRFYCLMRLRRHTRIFSIFFCKFSMTVILQILREEKLISRIQ